MSDAPQVDLVAFADWVTERAEKEAPKAPVDPEHLFVAFLLEREEYGLPVASVREILRVAEISRVPQAPADIRGVMNVRGKVLPVVEVRTRLGLPPLSPTHESRVVVFEVRERALGLLVDRVTRIAHVLESAIEAPPAEASGSAGFASGVTRGADGSLLVLLDPEKTLLVKG